MSRQFCVYYSIFTYICPYIHLYNTYSYMFIFIYLLHNTITQQHNMLDIRPSVVPLLTCLQSSSTLDTTAPMRTCMGSSLAEKQHSARVLQPTQTRRDATHDTRHTTHDTRHTTHDTRHTTTRHTTHDTRHTTHDTRHTTHDTRHTTHDTRTRHTTHDTRHTTHDTRHTTHDTRHTTRHDTTRHDTTHAHALSESRPLGSVGES